MTSLRNEVRLKLILQRGTELARLYRLPEVRDRCLQGYSALAEEFPSLAHARKDYLEMLGDSYRVLRSGASYAASEYHGMDEYIAVMEQRLFPSGSVDERLREGIARACTVLEPYRQKQQAILDRMTAHAKQRGLIKAVANRELHNEAIRAEFPDREDYLRHVPSLFDIDIKATIKAASIASADGEALRLSLLAEMLAVRVAVEYELAERCSTLYPEGNPSG